MHFLEREIAGIESTTEDGKKRVICDLIAEHGRPLRWRLLRPALLRGTNLQATLECSRSPVMLQLAITHSCPHNWS